MSTETTTGTWTVTLPSVNLLPPEIYAARTLRKVKAGAAGIALASVAVVAGLYVVAHAGVSSAQDDLNATKATTTTLQGQVAQYADVPVKYAARDNAEARQIAALGSEIRWSAKLDDLTHTIPKNVWLTAMTYTPADASAGAGVGTVQFTGKAMSHDDVATWLESLEQKGYSDPTFATSVEGQEPGTSKSVYSFSSSVTVTADALSNRYTKAGS